MSDPLRRAGGRVCRLTRDDHETRLCRVEANLTGLKVRSHHLTIFLAERHKLLLRGGGPPGDRTPNPRSIRPVALFVPIDGCTRPDLLLVRPLKSGDGYVGPLFPHTKC